MYQNHNHQIACKVKRAKEKNPAPGQNLDMDQGNHPDLDLTSGSGFEISPIPELATDSACRILPNPEHKIQLIYQLAPESDQKTHQSKATMESSPLSQETLYILCTLFSLLLLLTIGTATVLDFSFPINLWSGVCCALCDFLQSRAQQQQFKQKTTVTLLPEAFPQRNRVLNSRVPERSSNSFPRETLRQGSRVVTFTLGKPFSGAELVINCYACSDCGIPWLPNAGIAFYSSCNVYIACKLFMITVPGFQKMEPQQKKYGA